MVVIPFSLLPPRLLFRLSDYVMGLSSSLNALFPYLQIELHQANMNVDAKKYLALCLTASVFSFMILSVLLTLFALKINHPFWGLPLAFIASMIIVSMQVNYPKVRSYRRIRALEADLLAGLRAITVQLNSGVSLYEAMVIVSRQSLGEVSGEFQKTVKAINAGTSQISALESMALKNPSPYFRRTIWQIISGLKEGASITMVVNGIVANLTKEQIIQIEKYGSQLSPFAMFYMMGAIVFPALGVIFLIVITAFINMEEILVKLLFVGLLAFVVFIQIMFAGMIKTKRPSLLGD
ncbi:TPA: type II secretion system F family protein [Candidatus Woesearchaeota archaeon]|nr:type II secretion system F family protein [Candidatus Woesearchaeota archaeon]